jgi:hypothetical protein
MFPTGAPGDSLFHPESDSGDESPIDHHGTPEHEEWLIEMEEEDERWAGYSQ